MMQSIIVLFVLGISTVLGDVSEHRPESGKQPTQRALLLLPPQQAIQTNTTSQKVQDEEETPNKLSNNAMERLKQEFTGNTNVYYVYLPNGRLQKVEYSTPPTSCKESTNSLPRLPKLYKQYGYKTLQGPNNQQSNTQVVFGTNKETVQGNQQQQPRTNFENNKQQSAASAEYPQYQPVQQKQQTGNPSQLLAQYNGPEKLQNAPAAPSYIASVQFTDVPPVHGPVYAYSPSPLVRIVRYANTY